MARREGHGEVSDFYLACRNGDTKFVVDYLKKYSSEEQWDPNIMEKAVHSTPLHAASYYGHEEIVQLLLEYGCDRSKLNAYGLTAFEEASTDEIRQLFKRPDGSTKHDRFHDEDTQDCFDFVKRPTGNKLSCCPINGMKQAVDTREKQKQEETEEPKPEKEEVKKPSPPSVLGYQTKQEKQTEVGYATTSIAMCQSKLGRFLADKLHGNGPMSTKSIMNKLYEVVEEEIIQRNDPQSARATQLLMNFFNQTNNQDIEHLIRLYTLETKFYPALRFNPMPLALPLYITLEKLKNRFYEGTSYRGAKMDDDDIQTYQWAARNHGSLLQTRHFSSTSIERSVAEKFLNKPSKNNDVRPNSVLFMYTFPAKCEQAIHLGRVSPKEAALSDFEDEEEVLILPWSLFQVDRVEKQPSTLFYTIYVTNVPLPHKGLLSSFKWVLKHPKGSIHRFKEYFPEKQPDTVVSELKKVVTLLDEEEEKEDRSDLITYF